MKKRLNRMFAPLLSLVMLLVAAWSPAHAAPDPARGPVPAPASSLGFAPGEDRKLADYSQLVKYYQALAASSERVRLEAVGTSTEGRTMYVVYISAPKNLARLGAIKKTQQRLADPRTLTPEEAQKLIADQPAVVFINNAIHSTEIAAPHMGLELAYHLASANDADTRRILDDVVLIMNPVHNPDGHDMVVDWYRKTLGTPFEGTSPPELYQKYAGHDNNRDWYMFNLQETKVWAPLLFKEWLPNIIYDVHQMGSNGARFFVPPFFDPPNPEIDSTIITETMLIGGAASTRLAAKGLDGVVTNAVYDQWWHGGFRSAPYFHNMVGILTEAASAKLATPVEVPFDKLGGHDRGLPTAQQRYVNFPDPWPGGTWRMGDIIPYEYETSLAILDLAQRYRTEWHTNFYERNQRAVAKGTSEGPYAFIMPADQRDPGTLAWLVDILTFQGVEVHATTKPLSVNGQVYPEGSYVVLTAQPQRPNVMSLFKAQEYPPRFKYPGGPAEQPYDIAGWTLPMQMGLQVDEVQKAVELSGLNKVDHALPVAGKVVGTNAVYGYAFGPEMNKAAVARNRLFKAGYQMLQTDGPITVGGTTLAAGSTVVLQRDGADKVVAALATDLGLTVYALEQAPGGPARKLWQPRVGVYESWLTNIDAGWTRWLLDTYEFPFQVVRDQDIRKGGLLNRFDLLIMPDQSASSILTGARKGTYPDEYTGGIGDVGVETLRQFVDSGGTLLMLDSAANLAIDKLGVPVKDVLKSVKSEDFYVPGSILRMQVNTNHPLTYGMAPETNAYFLSSPAFEVTGNATSLASWPAEKLLSSGWLHGEQYIAGKSSLVEANQGKGHMVLVGFRAQHRGQSAATFKVLFNAIFYSASQPQQ